MPLFDGQIRAFKAGPKPRKHSDASGLHLLVTPGGKKLWRYAYRFAGKQKLLALGEYPLISLSRARQARDDAKRLLAEGADPGEARKTEKRRVRMAARDTFAAVADEWFENNEPRWVEGYAERLRSRLDADLLPRLGRRPISEIEAIEVLEVIRAIERRGAVEMARRVLQMASGIFRFGVATSRCTRDPTVDLRGALRAQAAPQRRTALPVSELPDFLAKLEGYNGEPVTRLALKLIVLTFVRSSELRFAQWSEIESTAAGALWRIPAERMKMRRPHLVPLAPQAVDVLRELRRFSGRSPFILPAATGAGVMSENTMIYALYRLGYHGRATVHGFRSLASTVLNEHQFNRDWIEAQLAHSDAGVRGIYNAAEWLPGRREMMCWWADYVDDAERRGSERAPPPVNHDCFLAPAPAHLALPARRYRSRAAPPLRALAAPTR